MTLEGEHDDITGAGQCHVALGLCKNIPANRKSGVDCPKVGHYGVFNGSRFRTDIAPRIAKPPLIFYSNRRGYDDQPECISRDRDQP